MITGAVLHGLSALSLSSGANIAMEGGLFFSARTGNWRVIGDDRSVGHSSEYGLELLHV